MKKSIIVLRKVEQKDRKALALDDITNKHPPLGLLLVSVT
jgi:hypothetical protein